MEDLKNIAPKLSKIKKENPFGVPHNYFDDFNARLQAKIKAESRGKKRSPVIRVLKPVIGIAASIAIIFMLVYWPLSNFNFNQTAENGSAVPAAIDSAENLLMNVVGDMDDNVLYSFLQNENQTEEDTVSDEAFTNYLSSNLSDYDIYLASAE